MVKQKRSQTEGSLGPWCNLALSERHRDKAPWLKAVACWIAWVLFAFGDRGHMGLDKVSPVGGQIKALWIFKYLQ